jgi:hypothetical protein
MALVDKVQGRATDLEAVWCWLAKLTVLNKITNVGIGLRKTKNPPNLFKLFLGSATPGNTGSWVYS